MGGDVPVAIEFKYEPDHARGGGDTPEIWPSKLNPSVVFWGRDGVLKDVQKCKRYVSENRCDLALLIFVDEGGFFRHRPPHPGTQWEDWECSGESARSISVLRGTFGMQPPGASGGS